MIGLSVELKPSRPAGALAPLFALGRPVKVAGLGDSIMAGDGEPTGQSRVGSWLGKAAVYTDGKILPLVYGYGGLTAVGHRGQSYKNDYQAAKPDVLVYHLGTNDMPASGSLTVGERNSLRAAILATAGEALAAGAQFVVFPEIVFTATKSVSETSLHNAWLAGLPATNAKFVFMPGFSGLYDPSISLYTGDGIHPNQNASHLMAKTFRDWIAPQLAGVRKFRELVVAAGSAGRRYQREPISLPFQSSVGGGYSASSTESGNLESGLAGSTVRIDISGDQSQVLHWNGPAVTSYANRWFIASVRVRASLLSSGRTFEAISYSKGSPDGGLVTFCEGQIDTAGEWGHIVMLNRATAAVTDLQLQLLSRELVLAETNSTGTVEIGEIYIHDLAEMEAGVAGLNWNM